MSRKAHVLRILDTGRRRAAENMAFNRALLESHQLGVSPHTLRFLQFEPCALLGFHQSAEQELRLDYCKAEGIAIQRRMTGGGAIYFDETQLGWELYLDKGFLGTADMAAIAERICTTAARSLQAFGVNAVFRPRNDIEVDGRKISGTGGAFDGDSILYQGTLLIEFDVERMLKILRIPAEKMSDKAIASARERVVNLADLLGNDRPSIEQIKAQIAQTFAQEFGVDAAPGDLLAEEQASFATALAEMDCDEWVYQHHRPVTGSPLVETIHRCSGGTLRVGVQVDLERSLLRQAWVTGDFFVQPRRLIADLEAALRHVSLDQVTATIKTFFDGREATMLRLTPQDFIDAVEGAVAAGRSGSADHQVK
ncbi:MAG: biotin/lipoate A/B protein ligase family protein [Thioalkalivibrionaceae bacterium]